MAEVVQTEEVEADNPPSMCQPPYRAPTRLTFAELPTLTIDIIIYLYIKIALVCLKIKTAV